jgi:hypothetical protein
MASSSNSTRRRSSDISAFLLQTAKIGEKRYESCREVLEELGVDTLDDIKGLTLGMLEKKKVPEITAAKIVDAALNSGRQPNPSKLSSLTASTPSTATMPPASSSSSPSAPAAASFIAVVATVPTDAILSGARQVVDSSLMILQAVPITNPAATIVQGILATIDNVKSNKDNAKAFGERLRTMMDLLVGFKEDLEEGQQPSKQQGHVHHHHLEASIAQLEKALREARVVVDKLAQKGWIKM